jgi:sigma-B regulation protein RsbU (phosphoserine phosphatase)
MVRDYILNICQRHGLSGRLMDDILLSSDEAATNIVMHAYKDKPVVNPDFVLELYVDAENIVRLSFQDRGAVFDSEQVQQPDVTENLQGRRKGGFGVYLIRSLMDLVEYKRVNDKNYLICEKKVSPITTSR